MNSLLLQAICVTILGVCLVLNRWSLIDPKLPLLGIGLAMAVWLLVGIYAVVVAVVGFYQSGSLHTLMWVTLGVGSIPIVCVIAFVSKVQQVPSIHDITTDTVNPPLFSDAALVRHASHNTVVYASDNAPLQAVAYPDVQPLFLAVSPEKALSLSAQVAQTMGWELYRVDEAVGVIEAYDKTALLGFVDDVVIRISAQQEGVRVDVRSASRIGVSDLGANAQRIRSFLRELAAKAR